MPNLHRVICLEVAVVVVMAVSALVCAERNRSSVDPPLYLTPLINQRRFQAARRQSRVRGFGNSLSSYAGYLTVDERYNSNMFFWLFPAKVNRQNAAVLLWLNGGPGASSLIGAFLENGPLAYTKSGEVKRRKHSWTNNFTMIYIDNPVGKGYSYTDHELGYPSNMTAAKENLYSALIQIFKIFPVFSQNDFYIGGQYYAGRYIPALGRYIHYQNHERGVSPDLHINLKGIYLGGALCDPPHMLPVYADHLYHMGILSKANMQAHKSALQAMFQRGSISTLAELDIIFSFLSNTLTTFGDLYTVLGTEASNYPLVPPLKVDAFNERSAEFRHRLHVGYASEQPNLVDARRLLIEDVFQDTLAENAFLMDRYKILQYTGNLDMLVGVDMTETFLEQVPWSGQATYNTATRQRWGMNGKLAGWVTQVGNFTRVIVRNAGQMVPFDKPEAALQMMISFVHDQPFEVFRVTYG